MNLYGERSCVVADSLTTTECRSSLTAPRQRISACSRVFVIQVCVVAVNGMEVPHMRYPNRHADRVSSSSCYVSAAGLRSRSGCCRSYLRTRPTRPHWLGPQRSNRYRFAVIVPLPTAWMFMIWIPQRPPSIDRRSPLNHIEVLNFLQWTSNGQQVR